jgi:hypothetical protein
MGPANRTHGSTDHAPQIDARTTVETPVDNANYQGLSTAVPENPSPTRDFASNDGGDSPQLVGHGRPARGYKWADATPGNTIALKHGAYSERTIAAKCETLEPGFIEWLSDNAPWAAAAEFAPQRLNLLRSQAITHLLFDDILVTAADNGAAKVPTRRLETALSALRGEREALALLGLTVKTKAELKQTVASTEGALQNLAATGRAIRLRRDAELAGTDEGGDDNAA